MNENCDYKTGPLQHCAPLSLAYVPPQQSAEPAYKRNVALPRGTLFPGLDLPFMNIVNRDMALDTPMLELTAIDFVTDELALYLDTHKNDAEAFAMYQSFLKLYDEAKRRYVELYGPISRADLRYAGSYTWVNDPWPWEYAANTEG